jgi:hypothetical protein
VREAGALRSSIRLMSGVGQTLSFGDVGSMSGLPPKPAVERTSVDVSNVPEAAVSNRSKQPVSQPNSIDGAEKTGRSGAGPSIEQR